ncbi:hypothetical protein SAMN02745753_03718 [Marinomonas polaris DSM 16579]|uniref:Uncharacterized protein n=1 Tax=Marinomonas polaris DSM 16579 TaxID=1122206 RepID=A0A1M5IZX6_9GAMM|nr:hypothetical protein [Marinomonas polaris]SHG33599.1 hypothetical protein SAMN02745753_03718 [Marinomonas polaris DSM 16579]
MTVAKEYWNIPKPSEDFLTTQGTNLTVFVDHAAKSTYLGLEVTEWTALFSLFVAAVAIYIARKANELTESEAKANEDRMRISIKPHLNLFERGYDDNNVFKVDIVNNGLGAAVINWCEFVVHSGEDFELDGNIFSDLKKSTSTMTSYDSLEKALDHLSIGKNDCAGLFLGKGAIMRSGDSVTLFKSVNLSTEDKLKLERLRVDINYQDVSGGQSQFLNNFLSYNIS